MSPSSVLLQLVSSEVRPNAITATRQMVNAFFIIYRILRFSLQSYAFPKYYATPRGKKMNQVAPDSRRGFWTLFPSRPPHRASALFAYLFLRFSLQSYEKKSVARLHGNTVAHTPSLTPPLGRNPIRPLRPPFGEDLFLLFARLFGFGSEGTEETLVLRTLSCTPRYSRSEKFKFRCAHLAFRPLIRNFAHARM